jgi:mono/diheme cytochrome c family protein
MRDREKEGKTRNLVPAFKESDSPFCLRALARASTRGFARARTRTLRRGLLLCLSLASSACNQHKPRSEWRAEDHQPPPAEPPEGQGAAEESGDPTARAARALWSMRCAQCHGEDGHGDGTGRPPGAQLPDFASPSFQDKRSDAELSQVIDKGRNMMPAFGQEITGPGIDALIGHVRSLRAK